MTFTFGRWQIGFREIEKQWTPPEPPATPEEPATPPPQTEAYRFIDFEGVPVPVLLRERGGERRDPGEGLPWLDLEQASRRYARSKEFLIGLHDKFFEDLTGEPNE